MDITIAVTKNLLDSSRIDEAGKPLRHDVFTCKNLTRITTMLKAGPGDRNFTVILDYDVYSEDGFQALRGEIDTLAMDNGVNKITYKSFVPHEKLSELQAANEDVEFIARSVFFRDLVKSLT